MRVSTLMALSVLAGVGPLSGADIEYRNGTLLKDARILSREPTYLIVIHESLVFTVREGDVTEKNATVLGLRPPTKKELLAREAARLEALRRADEQRKIYEEEDRAAIAAMEVHKEARREQLQAPPRTIHVPSGSGNYPETIARIQGKILARVGRGAIVQGDGRPRTTGRSASDYDENWIGGSIYVREHPRLNATSHGTPFSARLMPDGEFKYQSSDGSVHVLRAWRIL